jgi:glucosylceramidase
MLKSLRFAAALAALMTALLVQSSRPQAADAYPFLGSPVSMPGTVEAANFDTGPEGVSYYDTTPGNSGGAYRATDVDIEPSADGGYDVGWADAGEWLNYSVNVQASGTYTVQVRVASPYDGTSIHVGFNGPSEGTWEQMAVPNTGSWQSWTTIGRTVTLGAGIQQLTVLFDTGGMNLGRITVAGDTPPPPPPPPPPAVPTANIWRTTTTGSERLLQQAPVSFVSGSGDPNLLTIDVDESTRYQRIDGFGGSITDASAWVLAQAGPAQQASIVSALFDRQAGIGISFLRQPIGSSDFSLNPFTYDDIYQWGTDYDLASFSIDHDRAYILPALRAALAVNPAISVMASPWSPPAWMKTDGSLIAGSLRTTAFDAYARYLVKFIQAYQAEGVPIGSLTVQNEPLTTPPYPSMYMLAPDQATFIGQNLGPALAAAGLPTRVFTWDHNLDTTYPFTVLSDSAANSYVSGVSFHCYGGDPSAMTTFHTAYPDREIDMTECGDSSRATFGNKLTYDVRFTLIASLRNWATRVAKWNLVLDQNRGPRLYSGDCLNCQGMVTYDTSTGAVSFNEDYYAIGHASRFIQPGAYCIQSTGYIGGIDNVAAINPDGSIALLAINAADISQTFQIRWHGSTLTYTLDSNAVATFVWGP